MHLSLYRAERAEERQVEAISSGNAPVNVAEVVVFNICEWRNQLESLAVSAETLAGSTEEEFLSIGSELQRFYFRANEIANLSGAVIGEVSGDKVRGAIVGLSEMLDRMSGYLHLEEGETDRSGRTLDEILLLLDGVSVPLGGFKKIHKVLRMLSTSTKIESARLGQSDAGFDALASDVERLSEMVNEKSANILQEKEALAGMIRQTRAGVRNLGAEQRAKVATIIETTRSSLALLTDVNNRCSSVASVIATASAEVSQSIGEVVTSLQFHDISRQQIEHVKESFDDLLLQFQGTPQQETAGRLRDLTARTGDVCELQLAQLRFARDEMVNAVTTILQNLQGIARREADMAIEVRGLAGIADQTGHSFFAEMENGLSTAAATLAESAVANLRLAEAMERVGAMVGEISQFIYDIEDIGSEIELIALNAQIKAARTGIEGAALGVLAEAIQRLSVESLAQTQLVSESLRGITTVTEKLRRGVDAGTQSLESDVEEMVSDLRRVLADLQAMNDNLVGLLVQMDEAVQSLSADIETVTAGVTVHERVSSLVDDMSRDIEGMLGEVRQHVPAGTGYPGREELHDTSERYTMQSERRIHEAIAAANGTGGRLPHVGDSDGVAAGADLDDNVELF